MHFHLQNYPTRLFQDQYSLKSQKLLFGHFKYHIQFSQRQLLILNQYFIKQKDIASISQMQKSSNSIKSDKNIHKQSKHRKSKPGAMPESLQIIRHNCKSDHLKNTLMANTPSKISLYSKQYLTKKTVRRQKLHTQINKQNQLGNNNSNFTTYKLNQQIRNSRGKLPSIHSGSSYKNSFVAQQAQKVVKGKQQSTFFLKQNRALPALSEYRKSYEISPQKQQILGKQRGFPNSQSLFIPKYSHFRGSSNYKNEFHGRISTLVNADDCIKNKDHLTKKNTYPSTYASSQTHNQYERKDSYREIAQNSDCRFSSNQHYFPSRISTLHQYQSTYNNVYHRPFEEEHRQK